MLHRRFQGAKSASPGVWLFRKRLARARELLEGAALPVEDVAAMCGFGAAATMRRPFRKHLGTSPAVYRNRFRVPR